MKGALGVSAQRDDRLDPHRSACRDPAGGERHDKQHPGTTTNVTGSRALMPNSRPESTCVSASAPTTPMASPAAAIRNPSMSTIRRIVRRSCAERNANSDLLRPLCGAVCDDAIRADDGEHQGDRREHSEQQRGEAACSVNASAAGGSTERFPRCRQFRPALTPSAPPRAPPVPGMETSADDANWRRGKPLERDTTNVTQRRTPDPGAESSARGRVHEEMRGCAIGR